MNMNAILPCVKTILVLFGLNVGSILAEAAAPPEFTASLAEGKVKQGPLRQLGKDWSLHLGPANAPAVPAGDLLSLRQVGVSLPPLPEDTHLVLVNGDRIPIKKPRLQGERLHFLHPDLAEGKEVQVPIAAVALLWLEAPANADDPEKLRHRLLNQPRKRDRVLLLNGDAIEGTLAGLDARSIVLEVGTKTNPIDLKQAAAIALSTFLAETLRPKGTHAQVVLAGDRQSHGTRLTLSRASSDGKTLEGVTAFGAPLRVPLERVLALDVLQGRATYLSELKPSKYAFAPYLDVRWPLAFDASVGDKDLRVGPSVYLRGLGMHAEARATFALAGKYQSFEAQVGLDPRTGRHGRRSPPRPGRWQAARIARQWRADAAKTDTDDPGADRGSQGTDAGNRVRSARGRPGARQLGGCASGEMNALLLPSPCFRHGWWEAELGDRMWQGDCLFGVPHWMTVLD